MASIADMIRAANAVKRIISAAQAAPRPVQKAVQKKLAPVAPISRAATNVARSVNTAKASQSAPVRTSSSVSRTTRASSPSSGGSSGGSYSGNSGDYSGGGGGGGIGYSGAVAAPEPVIQDITIPDPLEDATYKKQKAELARARADFDAQQGLARGQYQASFDDAQRQLGWRNAVPRVGMRAQQLGAGNDEAGFDPNATGTAYGDAFRGNEGDFAGRGLYFSGLYGQAVSDLNQNFNDRRGTALRDKKSYEDTQDLNKKNYYGQQDAADLAAREDAINSIISQYGVSRDQVIPGRQNVIQRPV